MGMLVENLITDTDSPWNFNDFPLQIFLQTSGRTSLERYRSRLPQENRETFAEKLGKGSKLGFWGHFLFFLFPEEAETYVFSFLFLFRAGGPKPPL